MKKLLIAGLMLVISSVSWARQVDLVVAAPPGGPSDRIAQALLIKAKSEFAKHGMNLVVSYRPGAGTIVAINSVAASEPGRLQLLISTNAIITAPTFNPSTANYDIEKDFVLLRHLGNMPIVIVVNAASGIRTHADWQEACAKKPMAYGSSGAGTTSHLSSEVVNQFYGCRGVHVPYKGVAPAINDLLGRHIDYFSSFVTDALPHIESGKLSPIMTLDQNRSPELPNVPTVLELGYKDYNYYNWWVLLANANAAPADLALAQQIMRITIDSPEVTDRLREVGLRGRRTVPTDFLVREKRSYTRLLQNVTVKQ